MIFSLLTLNILLQILQISSPIMSEILPNSEKICSHCDQKDTLINKYTSLISLLKKQNQKTKSSLIQSRSQSSNQSSHLNNGSRALNIVKTIEKILTKRQYALTASCFSKMQLNRSETLAVLLISNKCKKSLLNQCFTKIKDSFNLQSKISQLTNDKLLLESSKANIINKLQSTLMLGKSMYSNIENQYSCIKSLQTKLFVFQLQNAQKDIKIQSLLKSLDQSQKRYYKETQKKRQSLQTVAEQIRQKNQIIQQMTNLIRKYESPIILKNRTDNLLIEDYDDLKSSVSRLENVNQKLNFDVKHSQQKIRQLVEKQNELQAKVKSLNFQNQQLKQTNFDLAHHKSLNTNMKKSLQSLCQKFNTKLQQLKLFQKQFNMSSKLLPKQFLLFSSQQMLGIQSNSLKKLTQTTDFAIKPSFKEINIQSKVESILTYLFHIQNQNYQIQNQSLFDSEELELLKSHKDLFLSKLKGSSKMFEQNGLMKLEKIKNHDQSDQIFYFDSGKLIQNSLFDAFNQKVIEPIKTPQSKGSQITANMKLIQMQIQKNNQIQKISELKNRYMHIRNVVLNLLKSLQLKNGNIKTQIQGILQIVFDIFEYSQQEKSEIFRQRKKRYFGLI